MKFTSAGGKLQSVKPAGDHCLLQVKTPELVFAPSIPRFHQAEGSPNRSYEGSGLGLALVKELVELLGANFSGVGLRRRKHVYRFANWHSSPLDQVLECGQK